MIPPDREEFYRRLAPFYLFYSKVENVIDALDYLRLGEKTKIKSKISLNKFLKLKVEIGIIIYSFSLEIMNRKLIRKRNN